MKKFSLIISALLLSITVFTTVQAAVGIPDYLTPDNVGMKGINQTITEKVKNSGDQQAAAVASVNIILQYVANLLLFVAAPLAVLFIARAGNDYAFALGEESQMESAKRELTYSLLGLLLIMFSYLIVRLIIQPFPILQQANNAALGSEGGSGSSSQTGSATSTGSSTGSGSSFNFDDAIKQVEENAQENPNKNATMYDPSGKLNGANAYIKNNGSTLEYYVDGDSVGKDNFTEMLKQYAAAKK